MTLNLTPETEEENTYLCGVDDEVGETEAAKPPLSLVSLIVSAAVVAAIALVFLA